MTSCLVACIDVSFECMTHGSWAMRRTTPSRLAWEARFLRTLRACTRGLKCTVWCIDFFQHREPNTEIVHDMVLDGALDGFIRATNHALYIWCIWSITHCQVWCSAGSDSHKFTVGCGAEPTVMSCTTQSGSSTSQNSDILSFSAGSSVNPTVILKISLLVDKPTQQ